jgi:deoxyribonuclease V
VWPADPDELAAIQRALAAATPPAWSADAVPAGDLAVAACVVCFPRGLAGRGATGDPAWAAATVWQGARQTAAATVEGRAGAPYVPGLLALREGPCLEAAVRALPVTPDVVLVDATGRDHPRRAGLALHLGAVLELPSVGVTHRPLLAAGPWPADVTGATAPLLVAGEVVGVWLRTRAGARPLAVHPGWRTDARAAAGVVAAVCRGHRTPEPLRQARRRARLARAAVRP